MKNKVFTLSFNLYHISYIQDFFGNLFLKTVLCHLFKFLGKTMTLMMQISKN